MVLYMFNMNEEGGKEPSATPIHNFQNKMKSLLCEKSRDSYFDSWPSIME